MPAPTHPLSAVTWVMWAALWLLRQLSPRFFFLFPLEHFLHGAVSEVSRILFSQVPFSKLEEALAGSIYIDPIDAYLSFPLFPNRQAGVLTSPALYLSAWDCCREVLLPFMATI